ncbi:hypothetical protein L6452_32961 [Arctium lappa]|uniref:Uncharacterized protein n=1 Tax=Arctium lappa TaxID=4217 RepID=A0ACB8Z6Y1_ARCLA|nr:hypothetical protein L6452_32961 [Arctium lappa]
MQGFYTTIHHFTIRKIRDGMYVRVHGQLKGLQGKRQLVVFAYQLSMFKVGFWFILPSCLLASLIWI